MSDFLAKAASFLGTLLTDNLLPAIIILVIGILIIRLVMKLITGALKRTHLEGSAQTLIKALLRVVLYVLLGLTIAEKLGIDTTGIVALTSVLTLAVSLSVQNALTNIIGGFTLLSTKPFSIGDFVEIAGQSGSIQSIGLTYTKLCTVDNKIISIPNSAVVSAQIVNFTVSGSRRVDITVSASYDAPVNTVMEALLEAAQVDTLLPGKEPAVCIKNYGDHAIEYLLLVWAATGDFWTTQCTVNKRIKEVFDAKGIEMTYPHLNVHLDKDS